MHSACSVLTKALIRVPACASWRSSIGASEVNSIHELTIALEYANTIWKDRRDSCLRKDYDGVNRHHTIVAQIGLLLAKIYFLHGVGEIRHMLLMGWGGESVRNIRFGKTRQRAISRSVKDIHSHGVLHQDNVDRS